MIATQKGNLGIVKKLILNNANYLKQDNKKWTCLHYATENKRL